MQVFVDTSGFLAAADRDDRHHTAAVRSFRKAMAARRNLVTHGMVVAETAALMHRRLGHDVALAFLDSLKSMEVVWVDQFLFAQGLERFRKKKPTTLSLVDTLSFAVMEMLSIDQYIGIDAHFESQGFTQV